MGFPLGVLSLIAKEFKNGLKQKLKENFNRSLQEILQHTRIMNLSNSLKEKDRVDKGKEERKREQRQEEAERGGEGRRRKGKGGE